MRPPLGRSPLPGSVGTPRNWSMSGTPQRVNVNSVPLNAALASQSYAASAGETAVSATRTAVATAPRQATSALQYELMVDLLVALSARSASLSSASKAGGRFAKLV